MSQTILLLKQKSTQLVSNVDIYEQKFNELGNYKVLYLPPLDFSLVNTNELISILKNGTANKYRGVIVTSQKAVDGLKVAWKQAFFSSDERNDVLKEWKELPYFVVGKSTAKSIKELNVNPLGADESGNSGLLADYIIKYFNSSSKEESDSSKQLELLFLVGDKRRDELPNKLLNSGFVLNELLIYETKPNSLFSSELNNLINEKIDWIVFFSPSGVDISLELLKNKLLEDWNKIKIATIGKTTSNHLERVKQIHVDITSPKPEAESLAKSIHEYN